MIIVLFGALLAIIILAWLSARQTYLAGLPGFPVSPVIELEAKLRTARSALVAIAAPDALLDANAEAFNIHAARRMQDQARAALVVLDEPSDRKVIWEKTAIHPRECSEWRET